MSEAHSSQLLYLLSFIGFLLLVIIGVIALSQYKKKKTPPPPPEVTSGRPWREETPPGIIDSEKVHQILETSPAVEAEVETNLKSALKKTEENFFGRIRKAFSNVDKKQVLEEVEEILYTSDLGPSTVQKLLAVVDEELSSKEMKDVDAVKQALKNEMIKIL